METMEVIKTFGLPLGMTVVALVSVLSGRWAVPRWVFDEMKVDRDELKVVNARLVRTLERLADLGEALTGKEEKP
jgi:hypothetical protein